MARITAVLTALNDLCGPISLPGEGVHYAHVFVEGVANGSVVLEVSGQDSGAVPPVDQWAISEMNVDTAGVRAVAAVIAAGAAPKFGIALVGGAKKVRVRKSVAGAGALRVTLSVNDDRGC